jgi:thiol-disulfide isomerase/thioredoxin
MEQLLMKPWFRVILYSFSIICLSLCVFSAGSKAADKGSTIKLEALKWTQFKERLASNKQAKYTLVDAWATNCGPCKENFPHLVEMHRKYAGKGLAVISLSLDDPSDSKAIAAAKEFLQQKQAVFTNILLDEPFGEGFEKLDINAIPAVFIFDPDGKELKRFTMDDPNHQFTYEQVEKEVVALMGGSGAPKSGN